MDTYIERFINNGLNSNVKFRAFWTNKLEAFDRETPKIDYKPIENASSNSIFPAEGWYECRIKRFKCKYYNLNSSLNFNNS